jgi:sugar/nucleoside kinase (ribokinase family)
MTRLRPVGELGPHPAIPDLVVIGDVMVDVSVEAPALARGGDVHGEVRIRPGGTAANAAVWAALAGSRVTLYGRVGDDTAGRVIHEALAERGVDSRLAVDPEERTGTMLVVREAGERSMVADRGANGAFSADDLPKTIESGAVLVSGYLLLHPPTEAAAREALTRSRARWIAVDAASWPLLENYGADRFLDATAGATVLFANEREVAVLAGDRSTSSLAERYEIVCVKRGAGGAEARQGGRVMLSTRDANEVDPTGAGDAFDGTFLAELVRGADLDTALSRASRAGAKCAESEDPWPPTRSS